jgi:hypothetical protein
MTTNIAVSQSLELPEGEGVGIARGPPRPLASRRPGAGRSTGCGEGAGTPGRWPSVPGAGGGPSGPSPLHILHRNRSHFLPPICV